MKKMKISGIFSAFLFAYSTGILASPLPFKDIEAQKNYVLDQNISGSSSSCSRKKSLIAAATILGLGGVGLATFSLVNETSDFTPKNLPAQRGIYYTVMRFERIRGGYPDELDKFFSLEDRNEKIRVSDFLRDNGFSSLYFPDIAWAYFWDEPSSSKNEFCAFLSLARQKGVNEFLGEDGSMKNVTQNCALKLSNTRNVVHSNITSDEALSLQSETPNLLYVGSNGDSYKDAYANFSRDARTLVDIGFNASRIVPVVNVGYVVENDWDNKEYILKNSEHRPESFLIKWLKSGKNDCEEMGLLAVGGIAHAQARRGCSRGLCFLELSMMFQQKE